MEFTVPPSVYALLGLGLAVLVRKYVLSASSSSNPNRLPFPPGPKPLPLLGNLRDMPADSQWLTYDRWAKEYGDIVSVDTAGLRLVVINSAKIVDDLFEKRSAIYSSRPRLVMLNELMGCDFQSAFMPYGDYWRARRRAFHPYVHQGAISQWEPIQCRKVHAFLRRLLEKGDTDDPTGDIRFLIGAIIMDIVYGIEVTDSDDSYITIAERAVGNVSLAFSPGAFLVDFIPWLKYVPAWMPGAGFKRFAIATTKLFDVMIHRPMLDVKHALQRGESRHGICAQLLSEMTGPDPETELVIRDVTGLAYGAGADTSSAAVGWFFLAMVLNQDIQRKAQAELDAVVGGGRLPDFSDRPDLPYVNAIVLEVLRWHPVTPLAIPHATTEDDEYEGYFIPRGAIVIGNAWAILHDPEAYPDPERFNPEHFLRAVPGSKGKVELDPTVRDPRIAAFGYGRRICPGRHMAEQSIFAAIASVLSVFNLASALDEKGVPSPPAIRISPWHSVTSAAVQMLD